MRLDSREAFSESEETAYHAMREMAADDSYTAERQLTDMRYLDLCESLDGSAQRYRAELSNGKFVFGEASVIRRKLQRYNVYIVAIKSHSVNGHSGESRGEHVAGEGRPNGPSVDYD